jgi:hypothetical protein
MSAHASEKRCTKRDVGIDFILRNRSKPKMGLRRIRGVPTAIGCRALKQKVYMCANRKRWITKGLITKGKTRNMVLTKSGKAFNRSVAKKKGYKPWTLYNLSVSRSSRSRAPSASRSRTISASRSGSSMRSLSRSYSRSYSRSRSRSRAPVYGPPNRPAGWVDPPVPVFYGPPNRPAGWVDPPVRRRRVMGDGPVVAVGIAARPKSKRRTELQRLQG